MLSALKVLCSAGLLCFAAIAAGEKPNERPISAAEKILTVYRDGREKDLLTLIFAAWADGHVVWSDNRIQGGPPFDQGTIDPKSFDATAALSDT